MYSKLGHCSDAKAAFEKFRVAKKKDPHTWLTVKGGTKTFLPWETGHPTTSPPNNQDDCVRVVTADAKFFDDRCNTQLAAICECE